MFGALAMMILAPIAAVMLQMALSRSREFEADHSGAELLGNGEPLARALEKIDAYAKQVPMNVDPAHATAYIINPLAGRKVNFPACSRRTRPPPSASPACAASAEPHGCTRSEPDAASGSGRSRGTPCARTCARRTVTLRASRGRATPRRPRS